jgi:hypothetical protein
MPGSCVIPRGGLELTLCLILVEVSGLLTSPVAGVVCAAGGRLVDRHRSDLPKSSRSPSNTCKGPATTARKPVPLDVRAPASLARSVSKDEVETNGTAPTRAAPNRFAVTEPSAAVT